MLWITLTLGEESRRLDTQLSCFERKLLTGADERRILGVLPPVCAPRRRYPGGQCAGNLGHSQLLLARH